MAYITNDGSRLIERARTEGKSIVFGSVRMNTIYKSDPYSLVQQTDEWFGENRGSVVGCISHVSVDELSQVCDSKLAVQCNDNSESWKSIGIYANLDGEVDEILFACESIENGEYKDVTIVDLPVTLDGVVADFGLSEGGSGSSGGGEVPANMMTTDTDQTGLSGTKIWSWDTYSGGDTVGNPKEGDRRDSVSFSIYSTDDGRPIPLSLSRYVYVYSAKDQTWFPEVSNHLKITADEVRFGVASASWSDIINNVNRRVPDTAFGRNWVEDIDGLRVFGQPIHPASNIDIDGLRFTFDSSGYLKSVCPDTQGVVVTIGVIVKDAEDNMVANGRVSGFSSDPETPLTFQSPIQLAAGYSITYQAIYSSL